MLPIVGFSHWFCLFCLVMATCCEGGGYFSSFPSLACFWAYFVYSVCTFLRRFASASIYLCLPIKKKKQKPLQPLLHKLLIPKISFSSAFKFLYFPCTALFPCLAQSQSLKSCHERLDWHQTTRWTPFTGLQPPADKNSAAGN